MVAQFSTGILAHFSISIYSLSESASFNNKDKQAIMKGNGNKMYIRVGVTTNGKVNYSEVVPVDVSF